MELEGLVTVVHNRKQLTEMKTQSI